MKGRGKKEYKEDQRSTFRTHLKSVGFGNHGGRRRQHSEERAARGCGLVWHGKVLLDRRQVLHRLLPHVSPSAKLQKYF